MVRTERFESPSPLLSPSLSPSPSPSPSFSPSLSPLLFPPSFSAPALYNPCTNDPTTFEPPYYPPIVPNKGVRLYAHPVENTPMVELTTSGYFMAIAFRKAENTALRLNVIYRVTVPPGWNVILFSDPWFKGEVISLTKLIREESVSIYGNDKWCNGIQSFIIFKDHGITISFNTETAQQICNICPQGFT